MTTSCRERLPRHLLPRQNLQDDATEFVYNPQVALVSGGSLNPRPYIVDVDLESLQFTADAYISPAWYESVTYFASLHLDLREGSFCGQFPERLHETFLCGHSAVSSAKPCASLPGLDDLAKGISWGERLSIRTEDIAEEGILILNLWGRIGTWFGSEDFILGSRAMSILDQSLQGRVSLWDVVGVKTGVEVAQVRLRLTASTAPGPIQLPHLSDVMPTSLQLNWSPPLEDAHQKRKVEGYTVSQRLPFSREWRLVCAHTSARNFEVDDLLPSTVYLVDIRAVNAVGEGASCEMEVSTAPSASAECADGTSA